MTPGRKVKILTPKLQLNHGSWRLRGLARVHDKDRAKTPGRKVKILTPKLQLNHGSWRLRGLTRVHD